MRSLTRNGRGGDFSDAGAGRDDAEELPCWRLLPPPLRRRPLRRAVARGVLDLLAVRDGLEGYRRCQNFRTYPAPMVVYDRDLNIMAWNDALIRLSRIPEEAVLGKPAWDSFPIIELNGALPGIEAALRGVSGTNQHWVAIPKTQVYVINRALRRPIYGWGGNIIGVLSWWKHVLPIDPFPWPDDEERAS